MSSKSKMCASVDIRKNRIQESHENYSVQEGNYPFTNKIVS